MFWWVIKFALRTQPLNLFGPQQSVAHQWFRYIDLSHLTLTDTIYLVFHSSSLLSHLLYTSFHPFNCQPPWTVRVLLLLLRKNSCYVSYFFYWKIWLCCNISKLCEYQFSIRSGFFLWNVMNCYEITVS